MLSDATGRADGGCVALGLMRGCIGWMHATVGILLSRVPPGRAEAFFFRILAFGAFGMSPARSRENAISGEESRFTLLGCRIPGPRGPKSPSAHRGPPRSSARRSGSRRWTVRDWTRALAGVHKELRDGRGSDRMQTRCAKCAPRRAVSSRNSGSRNSWNLDGTTPARWHMIPPCFRRHHAGWPQLDLDSMAADFNVDLAIVSPLWRV